MEVDRYQEEEGTSKRQRLDRIDSPEDQENSSSNNNNNHHTHVQRYRSPSLDELYDTNGDSTNVHNNSNNNHYNDTPQRQHPVTRVKNKSPPRLPSRVDYDMIPSIGYEPDLYVPYIREREPLSDEESLPDSGLLDASPSDAFILDPTAPLPILRHKQSSLSEHKYSKTNYRLKHVLRGHQQAVSQVRFSPDGKWIGSSAADATIKIWNAATGLLVHTLEGHLAGVSTFAWSPDSTTIASGADDKIIRMWDRATGRPQPNPLHGHHNYVSAISFSPKGNMLASGSYDEAVILWDVRTGRKMMSLPAHSDPVGGVDFNRDGTLIASCATDGLIRIWDSATGQCLKTIEHEDSAPVTNVRFSPNGKYVLAWTLDGTIRLWNVTDSNLPEVKKTFSGHHNKKYALGGAFGEYRGNPFIVTGDEDGKIWIWNAETKHLLQTWKGHGGVAIWADTHAGLNEIVTAGTDGVVRVWGNTDDFKPIVEPAHMLEADRVNAKKRKIPEMKIPTTDNANHRVLDPPPVQIRQNYLHKELTAPPAYPELSFDQMMEDDPIDFEPPVSKSKVEKPKVAAPTAKPAVPKAARTALPVAAPKPAAPKAAAAPPKPTAPKPVVAKPPKPEPNFSIPEHEDLSCMPRCQRCHKSKKGCDRQRPCQRCKDAGIPAEECVSEDESNSRKGRYGHRTGIPYIKRVDP